MPGKGLSLTAIVLAGLSVIITVVLSVVVMGAKANDHQLQGVCVTYDVNTVGTMVDQPVVANGTVMCQTGSFVPINPGKPSPGA